jgi:hypothetical protein
MKIIKRGTPPEQRIWYGKCRSCNSEIEAEQKELVNIQNDWREGTDFCWMKCPVCNAGNDTGYGGVLFYPFRNGG